MHPTNRGSCRGRLYLWPLALLMCFYMGPTQLSPGQALDRTATLQAKRVIDLKQMLRDRGLKVSGRKDELVHRLLAEPKPWPKPNAEEPKMPQPKPWPKPKQMPNAEEPKMTQPKPWPKPKQMPNAEEPKMTQPKPWPKPKQMPNAEEPKMTQPKPWPKPKQMPNAEVVDESLEEWRMNRAKTVEVLKDPTLSGVQIDEANERLKEYKTHFPETFQKLRDQQKHSIHQGLLRRGRCLVGDEMGLGKTLTSLVLAQMYAEEWPILVVAPTGVIDNWILEVKKWLPHMASEVEKLTSDVLKDKKKHLVKNWVEKMMFVTSYDQIWRHPALGRRADGSPYEVVILDEAHKIKDPGSARTKAMLPVCRAAKRCILLSGTPVLNCASETWTLMSALDLGMPSYEDFCERYCNFKETEESDGSISRRPIGARNEKELHEIFSSYMVRQKKEDVLPDLATITKCKKNFRDQIQGKYVQKIVAIMKQSNRVRQNALISKIFSQTAQAKAVPVVDFVESLLEKQPVNSAKMVVFGHHYAILDLVEKMLKRTGRGYVRIDGQVAKDLRQGKIDQFQEQPNIEVAIVGMKACGHGVSLTAADTVIFAELYWVPAILLQAEARVHRPGLEHPAKIIYCVVEGKPFMDDTVIKKIVNKERLADLITDGSASESSRFASLKA